MMAWRLHLSDRPIRRLDILDSRGAEGKRALIAAWTHADRVTFLDLDTGARVGEKTLTHPPAKAWNDPVWRAHFAALIAPNAMFLPVVRTPIGMIVTGENGSVRLLAERAEPGAFTLDIDGVQTVIETGVKDPTVWAFEPISQLFTLMDRGARLHLYQGARRLGIFEVGLFLSDEYQPTLAIPAAGTHLYVSDGRRIVKLDANGKTGGILHLHYAPGTIAVSPDGNLLVTTDLESNVLRVYNAPEFTLSHQRFGIDLIADAKRTQLVGGSSVTSAALGAVAVTNEGLIAFSMGGALCVTHTTRMKVVSASDGAAKALAMTALPLPTASAPPAPPKKSAAKRQSTKTPSAVPPETIASPVHTATKSPEIISQRASERTSLKPAVDLKPTEDTAPLAAAEEETAPAPALPSTKPEKPHAIPLLPMDEIPTAPLKPANGNKSKAARSKAESS